MLRWRDITANQQFFVELLAWPQASELYGNVASWISLTANGKPGEMNHFLGKLSDFNGSTHVQNENLTIVKRVRLT